MNKRIKTFLVLFFPGPLKAYLKWRYREDIYKLLKFLNEYKQSGSDMMTGYHVMRLDHDWSVQKYGKILSICFYLGYISGGATAKKSIYEKVRDRIQSSFSRRMHTSGTTNN